MRVSEPHRAAIVELVRRLPLDEVNWALTGSAGHVLQGLPLGHVGDLDVQTDAEGIETVAERFAELMVEPVSWRELERVRSFFGKFQLKGVEVDIIGAGQIRDPDGAWGPVTDPAEHRRMVSLGEHLVPVLSLDYEAEAYAHMGRQSRADLILSHLAER
ncbi:nucleotidyltransferase domain-containing protein [Nonomuraea sp. NPDC002799]